MNALKHRFLWLLSFCGAACSGTGQEGLVTVGIRPTVVGAATVADAGAPSRSSNDVMNQLPDASNTTPRAALAGASGGVAGMGVRTPSETITLPNVAIAGAGGAGQGAAGASGSLARDDSTDDECGAIPAQAAGNATSGRVSGPGLIEYDADVPNVFTHLRTTLAVPAEPPPSGPVFIWAGIQPTPNATNFQPIGNGGLMSVLIWGTSCSQDAPPSYSTWWTAPIYSNISSSDPAYSGCHAGKVTLTKPKQLVDIDIQLAGTSWTQNVVNRDTMEASDFTMDLKGQEQGRVFFDIELLTSGNKPTEDVIFTHTVLSMAMSDANACQPVMRGMNDFASRPRVSADGKHCCIDRIVLRAPGVMATTMDPP